MAICGLVDWPTPRLNGSTPTVFSKVTLIGRITVLLHSSIISNLPVPGMQETLQNLVFHTGFPRGVLEKHDGVCYPVGPKIRGFAIAK